MPIIETDSLFNRLQYHFYWTNRESIISLTGHCSLLIDFCTISHKTTQLTSQEKKLFAPKYILFVGAATTETNLDEHANAHQKQQFCKHFHLFAMKWNWIKNPHSKIVRLFVPIRNLTKNRKEKKFADQQNQWLSIHSNPYSGNHFLVNHLR